MGSASFHVVAGFLPLLKRLGIASAEDAFQTPHAKVWRSIRERENATIDPPDGSPRLHLKRDKLNLGTTGAASEGAGILTLAAHGLPTATLVAYGTLPDARSFAITEDLCGFAPADQLIRAGTPFNVLAPALGAVAGRLHQQRLFHQDLYLCHFFAKIDGSTVDVRLIDLARVLDRPFCPARWHVKDLAQLVYSTRDLPITSGQLDSFFDHYSAAYGAPITPRMRRLIDFKAGRIARHDIELHRRQPGRDVSIPE